MIMNRSIITIFAREDFFAERRIARFAFVGGIALLCLTGCRTPQPPGSEPRVAADQSALAVLWYQRSAECRALYYQACNIARERIEQRLEARRAVTPPDTRKPAIIVDIDETVLDNSANQARLIIAGTNYNEAMWKEWVDAKHATALPGIHNLFRFCADKGVEIFYVSNRKLSHDALTPTIENLHKQGLPNADAAHVRLRSGSENKDDRRGPLLTNGVYDVILLMGDNLGDFHRDFDATKPSEGKEREPATDRDAALFGVKYIILPNPMYGTWENVLYDKAATNKSVLRRDLLKPFRPEGKKR
jgi:5'-nucleotidase (lipoprotein e(P4) family)